MIVAHGSDVSGIHGGHTEAVEAFEDVSEAEVSQWLGYYNISALL